MNRVVAPRFQKCLEFEKEWLILIHDQDQLAEADIRDQQVVNHRIPRILRKASVWPARKDGHFLGENQCRNSAARPDAPRSRSAILQGTPGPAIASALASLYACHPRPVNGWLPLPASPNRLLPHGAHH